MSDYQQMEGIVSADFKGGVFFHKIGCNVVHKPKFICIEQAKRNDCEFVVEVIQSSTYDDSKPWRKFGYYKDVDSYLDNCGSENNIACEIGYGDVKLYFDIDYYHSETKTKDLYDVILNSIKKHYEDFFGHPLKDSWLFVCSGSGDKMVKGEMQYKHSYHIVVKNGLYFNSTTECKRFIQYIKRYETNTDVKESIDIAVYGVNQNLKLPFQTKFGETRMQLPLNGTFKDHLFGRYSFEEFNGYYQYTYDEKEQRINESNDTDVGIIHNDVVFDDGMELGDLRKLLELLGNNDYGWDTYWKVCCIIKNEGGSGKMFHDWCKTSSKYIERDTTSLWESLKPQKIGYDIQTLVKMVTKKYPKLFKDKEEKYLDSVTIPTINLTNYGYEQIEYNQKYCKSLCDVSKKYDTIVLKSHLGTGKTTMICDLIKKNKYESVLCITPRVMFANSIFASLKKADDRFELYKDVNKATRKSSKFLVCQLESLISVSDHFDCIIMDESESNFMQFNSDTVQNFRSVTSKFEKILANAKMVLCGDAFITNRTLCLMHLLRPYSKKVYIHNTFQPYSRKAYCIGNTDAKMVGFVRKFTDNNPKDRNVIATGSRVNGVAIKAVLDESGSKNLFINSYSSDKIAKQLQDVNSLWDEYQHVMYTSSITVGVSYDSDYQFDNLMLHFTVFGCCVRDMFQASLRARVIKTNRLFYSRYSVFFGLKRYQVFDYTKMKEIVQHREVESTKFDDWVSEMWIYNELELSVNAFYHKKLVDRYLDMCGYVDEKYEQEEEVFDKDSIDHLGFVFGDIDDIDYEDYRKLYSKIVCGDAGTDEKLMYVKYEFLNNVLVNHNKLEVSQKESMWECYIQKSSQIKKFLSNIKYENGDDHEYLSIYQDNTEQKLNSLKEIKAIFDIEKTFDMHTIPRNKISEMTVYIDENRDTIHKVWGVLFKKGALTEKGLIGCMHQIFGIWIGGEFKRSKRERKMTAGVRVDVSQFELSPSKFMQPFIQNQKDGIGCRIVKEDDGGEDELERIC